ncbi:hypothetical protein L1I79_31065 [Strepomyces sp. STD 3.1]|uniref:hypothetical protein n=1 Tax=Streptomyces sp. NPDC058985 TaxID=3346684 RepID=UPI001F1F2398|nr:hypothetical protein [Streptomyces sp. STD 3.1]
MTPRQHRRPSPEAQGAVLANEAEGYLLAQTELDRARGEAALLCSRLPWLTTGQAEDLTLHYVRQRVGLTRQALQVTADRAQRLRGEYETRYRHLRRTLLRQHAACACLLIACCSLTCLLKR